MITRRAALTRATDQLSMHPELRPTALPDAALLLMHLLQLDRAALIAHPEAPLDREQLAQYQRLIERRLRFEPIQYIIGEQEFYGLTLKVTRAVLIPRPETELLVEAVLNQLENSGSDIRILDMGTGSGAIAIALANALPQAEITAVDLSREALAIAGENATNYQANIRLLQSDLLEAVADDAPYDVIVSNPPYIPDGDASTLHAQVRDHEPAQALFAGPAGIDIYERLIPQAHKLLKPGGLLALEIGFGQQSALRALLAAWIDFKIIFDLQGIPRVVLARKPAQGSS